jgi:arylsulfatase
MPGPVETHQSYGLPWANVSNTPFRLYKHWVHEGGISTPLIVHWPKIIKQAGFTSQVGHVIDLMATCVDVAGAAYPTECQGQPVTPLEGRSFAPALRGQVHVRDPIFWEHEGNRAVRQGNWKLVSRFPDKWELYDLQTDRTEMNDLAEQKADKVAELKKLYEAWAGRANVADWAKLHPSAR